ncbi:hypothetical protein JCM11641_002778 [Rhodosporidiobolus odoratus]
MSQNIKPLQLISLNRYFSDMKHASGEWRENIMKHIGDMYGGWSAWQTVQAGRILSALVRQSMDRNAKLSRNPFEPSPDNVHSILLRTSKGNQHWVDSMEAWIRDNWNIKGYSGNRAIVASLLETEQALKSQGGSLDGYYETHAIGKLETALAGATPHPQDYRDVLVPYPPYGQAFVDNLVTLSPDIYERVHAVAGPRPAHQMRAIGHRTARHYGTTKARWEAGQGW